MAGRHSSPDRLCSPISSTIVSVEELGGSTIALRKNNKLGEHISCKIHWSPVTETAWALLNLRLEPYWAMLWCWVILENHHESSPDIQLRSDSPISRFRFSCQDLSDRRCQKNPSAWGVKFIWKCNGTRCQFDTWMSSSSVSLSAIDKKKAEAGRNHLFTMYQGQRVSVLLCNICFKIS